MSQGHTSRLEAALAGRYKIERKLGEGGMASVYLAEDLKHERKVALKILRPELAAVIGAERFLSEIKTTANLQHPHILPLFDSGSADGYLYYVMPYIDGETLRDKLDREKQLGVEESVRIARDVADALDYAHRHGVIHRDIKPGNILLHDGRPVVADFGIALAVSAAGGGRMTETGLSLGTPHYMSPEQASADRDLSARSDVYSLGCVLYEMLAGQPPHTGPSAQSILVHILTEDPKPLTSLRHTVPANVAAAVAKSIEKLPADRFESARQFRDALEDTGFAYAARTKAATGAVAPALHGADGIVRRWKGIAVAASSLAAVFALALAWSLGQPAPSASPVVQVLSTDGWAGLDREIGRVAALAPDGSSMILPLSDGTLGVKLATSADIMPIPGTEGARDVVYSPDGQSILYAAGTEILRRPLFGGTAIRLVEDAEGNDQRVGMAWLDDGTMLLERQNAELSHLSENGEPLGTVEGFGGLYWMEALPGGRGALAVAAGPRLHAVDLEDYSTAPLLDDVFRAWYAPTGHLVYVRRDGAVFAQPFDLDALELSGGAIPLFEGVRVSLSHADMRLTRDGGLLYVEGSGLASGSGHRLLVVDLQGNRQVLPLPERPIAAVNWSPDGVSVAFQSQGQVYTYNTVLNTTPRQITFEGLSGTPIFSPDGSRLAFFHLPLRPDGTGIDLFVKELEDDTPPHVLASLDGQQVPMHWASETLIAFLQGTGPFDLWTVDLSDPDAPEARPYLTSEASLAPISVSPDGTLAAYASDETGIPEVYIRSFPVAGERTVVSRGGGMGGIWSPDGSTLYYSASADAESSVVTMVAARLRLDPVVTVLSTDTLFTIEGVPPRSGQNPLHPDGDRFIFPVAVEGGSGAEARGARLILVQNWFEELRDRVGGK
jgi:Tol biopolymer transport system component